MLPSVEEAAAATLALAHLVEAGAERLRLSLASRQVSEVLCELHGLFVAAGRDQLLEPAPCTVDVAGELVLAPLFLARLGLLCLSLSGALRLLPRFAPGLRRGAELGRRASASLLVPAVRRAEDASRSSRSSRGTDREVLQDAGRVTAEIARAHAESEFEKYRIVQDRLFESDFDRAVAETKTLGEAATKGTPRKGEGKKP